MKFMVTYKRLIINNALTIKVMDTLTTQVMKKYQRGGYGGVQVSIHYCIITRYNYEHSHINIYHSPHCVIDNMLY